MTQPSVAGFDTFSGTAGATSYQSGNSKNWLTNHLYVAQIHATRSSGGAPGDPTVTLASHADVWTKLDSGDGGSNDRSGLWALIPAADVTGDVIKADFGATSCSGCDIDVVDITAYDGSTIASAIIHISSLATGNSAAPTASLPVAPGGGNRVVGFMIQLATTSIASGSGYSELNHTAGHTSPSVMGQAEADTGTPAQNATWTITAANWRAWAIEVAAVSSGVTHTVDALNFAATGDMAALGAVREHIVGPLSFAAAGGASAAVANELIIEGTPVGCLLGTEGSYGPAGSNDPYTAPVGADPVVTHIYGGADMEGTIFGGVNTNHNAWGHTLGDTDLVFNMRPSGKPVKVNNVQHPAHVFQGTSTCTYVFNSQVCGLRPLHRNHRSFTRMILDHELDWLIDEWIADVSNLGRVILATFWHEPLATEFLPGEALSGWADAFEYVIDYFNAAGVTNVMWASCLMGTTYNQYEGGSTPQFHTSTLIEKLDAVGADIYLNITTWQTPETNPGWVVFDNFHPEKPHAIFETALQEGYNNPAPTELDTFRIVAQHMKDQANYIALVWWFGNNQDRRDAGGTTALDEMAVDTFFTRSLEFGPPVQVKSVGSMSISGMEWTPAQTHTVDALNFSAVADLTASGATADLEVGAMEMTASASLSVSGAVVGEGTFQELLSFDPNKDWRTLTATERAKYFDVLKGRYAMRIDVSFHNLNEVIIASGSFPTSMVNRGEVQVSADSTVQRQLNLELVDPKGQLSFPTSPDEAFVTSIAFVSVRHAVLVRALNAWITVPIFWGVVTRLERTGPQLIIEAQDKAMLLQQPRSLNKTTTYLHGAKITNSLKDLAGRFGETRFAVPDMPDTLLHNMSITKDLDAWEQLSNMAKALDRQLFYSGDGRLTLRRMPNPGQAVWSFTVTDPKVVWDLANLANFVEITSGVGGGGKQLIGTARADPNHPLSAQSLARNSKTVFLRYTEQDDTLTTQKAVQARADSVLVQKLSLTGSAEFDSYPVPFLNPYDRIAVVTPEWRSEFNLLAYTIPLIADGLMSVGTLTSIIDVPRVIPVGLTGRIG